LLDKRVVIVEPLHAAMMCNGNKKAHDLYPFDLSAADYWAFEINMRLTFLAPECDCTQGLG
jgi:hypothetical protein